MATPLSAIKPCTAAVLAPLLSIDCTLLPVVFQQARIVHRDGGLNDYCDFVPTETRNQ